MYKKAIFGFSILEFMIAIVLIALINVIAFNYKSMSEHKTSDIGIHVLAHKISQANLIAQTSLCEIKVDVTSNDIKFWTRSDANNCNSDSSDYAKPFRLLDEYKKQRYTFPVKLRDTNSIFNFIINTDGSIDDSVADTNSIHLQFEDRIIVLWKMTGYVEIKTH